MLVRIPQGVSVHRAELRWGPGPSEREYRGVQEDQQKEQKGLDPQT